MYICSINNMMTRLTFNSINKIGIGKSIYIHVAPCFILPPNNRSHLYFCINPRMHPLLLMTNTTGVYPVVAERAILLLLNITVHFNQTAMCLYMQS